jgi:rhodanese-related sulfurtransferase
MKSITAKELQAKLSAGENVFLLDVREDFEHEAFNIGGKLIPLGEVNTKASEIPTDKPVIVYCRKGIRSQIAIQRLEEKFGFKNLFNLKGGVENWDM